jgi:hypothetical protein
MISGNLNATVWEVHRLVSDGFHTAWIGKTKHDVFLRCAAAAAATPGLRSCRYR